MSALSSCPRSHALCVTHIPTLPLVAVVNANVLFVDLQCEYQFNKKGKTHPPYESVINGSFEIHNKSIVLRDSSSMSNRQRWNVLEMFQEQCV